jgi:hypothetical protein
MLDFSQRDAGGKISPMPDHLLILRLSGDFYTKARRTRMRFFRRLASNLEAARPSGTNTE